MKKPRESKQINFFLVIFGAFGGFNVRNDEKARLATFLPHCLTPRDGGWACDHLAMLQTTETTGDQDQKVGGMDMGVEPKIGVFTPKSSICS